MPTGITIVGMERTLRQINKVIDQKQRDFRARLIAAGLFIEAEATKEITATLYSQPEPADKYRKRTGNLRASKFTVWTRGRHPATPEFKNPTHPGMTKKEAALSDQTDAVDCEAAFQTAVVEGVGEVDNRTCDHFAVLVGYGASYALYVHEGTHRMAGYHWLSNTLEKNRNRIQEIITGNEAMI